MTAIFQIETRDGKTKLVTASVDSNNQAMEITSFLRDNSTVKQAKVLGNYAEVVSLGSFNSPAEIGAMRF